MDASAFAESGITTITVAEDNSQFFACDGFLLDSKRTSVIRYFGSDVTLENSANPAFLVVSGFQHCHSNQILNLIELRLKHSLDVHYSNRFVFLPLLPFLVNPASLDVDPFQH
jgi:hypothetical protein